MSTPSPTINTSNLIVAVNPNNIESQIPQTEEQTVSDYLGRQVTVLTDNMADCAASCCNMVADTVVSLLPCLGLCLAGTAVGAVAIAPEVIFISFASICLSDHPEQLGTICTRDKYGRDVDPARSGAGFIIGAVAYPCALAAIAGKYCLKH